jgi:hypothetical protein
MILFDAHVHIYPGFDLDAMMASAFADFRAAMQHLGAEENDCTCFLLLSESGSLNYFQSLRETARSKKQDSGCRWRLEETEERCSLGVRHDDFPGVSLFIAAGRQLVTAERLELLALLTDGIFPENKALDPTVAEINRRGGIAVCPWGAGKWLGRRGEVLKDFLNSPAGRNLYLGDSGGRPLLWPGSKLFQTVFFKDRLVSGTDPLPLAGEELRVGSFGGYLAGSCSMSRPAESLKKLLTDDNPGILPFGRPLNPLVFIKNQVLLRLKHKA